MAEYIKREAVLRAVQGQRSPCQSPAQNRMLDCLKAAVIRISAADVAPVVHGCFEPCFDENGNWRQGFAKCSNCGKEYYAQVINHFGYCPNCGAKMDGERKDGGDG